MSHLKGRRLSLCGNESDVRGDIREFPTTRRTKITSEHAGLLSYRSKRRVPGLRREEAALLAETREHIRPRVHASSRR